MVAFDDEYDWHLAGVLWEIFPASWEEIWLKKKVRLRTIAVR